MKILNAGLMMPNNYHSGFRNAMKLVFDDYYEYETKSGCAKNLYDYYKRISPDFVFIQLQQTGVLTKEIAKDIQQNSKLIIWNGDKRSIYPPFMEDVAEYCHCVTHSNEDDVNYIQSKGACSSFLQIGFDDAIFKQKNLPKTNDIVFMGNHYENTFPLSEYRYNILLKLYRTFNRGISIYGARYKHSLGIISNQLHETNIYNSHKIGLNINHFDTGRFTSDRILRIMGSGLFCISQYYENIEKDFDTTKHLVVYRTDDELIDKICYYLKNDTEREEIAKNGQEYVQQNFSFLSMAKNIKKLFQHESPNNLL